MLNNPTLSNGIIRRYSIIPDPKDYKEFLNLLYDDLDLVVTMLSQNKKQYHQGMVSNPRQGEDLINTVICNMLSMRGWQASHDTYVNGHADIVVTLPNSTYQWLGEGKILNSNTYLYKGLKQLLYRYSTGLDNQNAGGLIAYIKDGKNNIKELLDTWRDYLNKQKIQNDELPCPSIKRTEPCQKNDLVFYTYHNHPASGLEYGIRHIMIDFRYNPQD